MRSDTKMEEDDCNIVYAYICSHSKSVKDQITTTLQPKRIWIENNKREKPKSWFVWGLSLSLVQIWNRKHQPKQKPKVWSKSILQLFHLLPANLYVRISKIVPLLLRSTYSPFGFLFYCITFIYHHIFPSLFLYFYSIFLPFCYSNMDLGTLLINAGSPGKHFLLHFVFLKFWVFVYVEINWLLSLHLFA